MSNIKVSPSILSGDFAKLGESVAMLDKWGADMVHIDVMDGTFVPNLTFGMPVVKAIRSYSSLPFDVHLMIEEPERYVTQFVQSGADIVSFHPNATDNIGLTIEMIKVNGAKCGLVVNPDFDVSVVEPYLSGIDVVTLMGVYAGFGGQKYIQDTNKKIGKLRKLIDDKGYNVDIEIDGGVTVENCEQLKHLGATILVAGTAVFGASAPAQAIKTLKA